jgi:hypothetical protein
MQRTRPQTIGYALTDSPAGLAAWITEKLMSWTDPRSELSSDTILEWRRSVARLCCPPARTFPVARSMRLSGCLEASVMLIQLIVARRSDRNDHRDRSRQLARLCPLAGRSTFKFGAATP